MCSRARRNRRIRTCAPQPSREGNRVSDPIRFLNAFGKCLSAMALYSPTHPARARSSQLAFEAIQELQRSERVLRFSFLGDEIVFQNRHLRELRDWEWSE